MRCIELSQYYMNHLLIQPEVKPTDDDYMDIYERYNKITIAKIKEIDGEMKSKKIETSVGRIIFNQGIPQDLW